MAVEGCLTEALICISLVTHNIEPLFVCSLAICLWRYVHSSPLFIVCHCLARPNVRTLLASYRNQWKSVSVELRRLRARKRPAPGRLWGWTGAPLEADGREWWLRGVRCALGSLSFPQRPGSPCHLVRHGSPTGGMEFDALSHQTTSLKTVCQVGSGTRFVPSAGVCSLLTTDHNLAFQLQSRAMMPPKQGRDPSGMSCALTEPVGPVGLRQDWLRLVFLWRKVMGTLRSKKAEGPQRWVGQRSDRKAASPTVGRGDATNLNAGQP